MRNRATMPGFRTAVVALTLVSVAATVGGQDTKKSATLPVKQPVAPVDVPRIAYTRFVLANGLTVILHEDHSSPIVTVNLGYHVGSKDEEPGKRGFAHLFEHAMFGGSAHVRPNEFNRIIQDAGGGVANAETREDRTVYHESATSNMLETILWLEADRMATLPATLDSQRFELTKSEVINEYGNRFEAQPAPNYLAQSVLVGGLFPESSPYHFPPIGSMADIRASSLDDVRAFFKKYYVPNNATLVVAGDLDPAGAKKMVEKYFGTVARGTTLPRKTAAPSALTSPARLVLEDRFSAARQLWIAWQGVGAKSADRLPLVALADILASGQSSRLSNVLINQRRLATSLARSGAYDLEDVGIFQISAAAVPTASLTDIENVVDSAVADIRENGVTTQELRRWMAGFAVRSLVQRQSASLKAELLEDGDMMYGHPAAELDDISRARLITRADIQRVARTYLGSGRVVISIVPAGKLDAISKPSLPYQNVTPR